MFEPNSDRPNQAPESLNDLSNTAEQNQAPDQINSNTPPKTKSAASLLYWLTRRTLRILILLVLLFLLIVAGICFYIYQASGDDKKTADMFEQIKQHQSMFDYKSLHGNLRDGVRLNDVTITTPKVDIKIDQAELALQWQSLIHSETLLKFIRDSTFISSFENQPPTDSTSWLSQAAEQNITLDIKRFKASHLRIIKKTPSSNEPFEFAPITLPIGIKIQHAEINDFRIVRAKHSDIVFDQITLKQAKWHKNTLDIAQDSSLIQQYVHVSNIRGRMTFTDKYPLDVHADVNIPSLKHFKAQPITVHATGTLDSVQATLDTQWPDPLHATGTVHPVRNGVPYHAVLDAPVWHVPFALSEQITGKNIHAVFDGHIDGVNIDLNTHLQSKHIPEGEYTATASTDYRQLNVSHAHAIALDGQLDVKGNVNWHNTLAWDFDGQAKQLNVKRYPLIPTVAHPYIPDRLTGHISTKATLLANQTTMTHRIEQTNGEVVQAVMTKAAAISNNRTPLLIKTEWQQLQRNTPVGLLNSPNGTANISLEPNGTVNIQSTLNLQQQAIEQLLKQNSKQPQAIHLPSGQYQATMAVKPKGQGIDFSQIKFHSADQHLTGSGHVQLEHDQHPLAWQFDIAQLRLDLNKIIPSAPVGRLAGSVIANGIVSPRHYTVNLQQTNLAADLLQPQKKIPVRYAGTGQLALDFKPAYLAAKPSQSKSFSVNTPARSARQAQVSKHSASPQFDSYQLTLNGQLDTPFYSRLNTQVIVSGTRSSHQITQLNLLGKQGERLRATGSVGLKPAPRWNMTLDTQQMDLSLIHPQLPKQLSGNIHSQGVWGATDKRIQIEQTHLTGMYHALPFEITGQADVNVMVLLKGVDRRFSQSSLVQLLNNLPQNAQTLNASSNQQSPTTNDLTVRVGDNALRLTQPNGLLSASLNLTNLQQILPKFEGRLQGQVSVDPQQSQQPLQSTLLNLTVQADQLSTPTAAFATGNITGKIDLNTPENSKLDAHLYGLSVGPRQMDEVAIAIKGSLQQHIATLAVNQANGSLGLNLVGGFNQQYDWSGITQNGVLRSMGQQLKQIGQPKLSISSSTQSVQLDQHCWTGNGELCLTENLSASAKKGKAALSLNHFNVRSLSAFMPKGLFWLGDLYGHGQLAWSAQVNPTLNLEMNTEAGQIGLEADDPQDPPLIIPYDHLSLKVNTLPEGMKLRFDMKTPAVGTGYIDAIVDPKPTPKTINGALVLDNVDLNVFKIFFPKLRTLSGQASLAGGMSGKLQGPDFYGEFKLKDGQVVAKNLPINLHSAQLKSSVRGDNATLAGDFLSGEGQGKLTGALNWHSDMLLQLNLAGDELEVNQAPALISKISPKLALSLNNTQKKLSIKGSVDIPEALITPPPQSTQAIHISDDAVIDDPAIAKAQTTENTNKARVWDMDNQIDIQLGKKVFFRGYGANIPLVGSVHMLQKGNDKLSTVGTIEIAHVADVQAFGQTMLLKRGSISFNGVLSQPMLDVQAEKNIENKTVGFSVYGSPLQPKVTLFNNAGLSEQEAMNAIITDQLRPSSSNNTAGFQTDANNTLAAAGISLALSGSRQFTYNIAQMLGLNNLTLDAAGAKDTTQVNVTGYLTPNLYLRYGMGVFTPVNTLTLRYQLNKRTYLEATSALEKTVDLFYNWKF